MYVIIAIPLENSISQLPLQTNLRKEQQMKYYLVEIKNTTSKGDEVSLGSYDERDKAEASYHRKISTAMRPNSEYKFQTLAIINDTMAVEMSNVYVADGVGLPDKYYLTEVFERTTEKSGASIKSYDTRKEAIADFHQAIGNAMNSDLYTSDRAIVLNSSMGDEISKVYVAKTKDTLEEVV